MRYLVLRFQKCFFIIYKRLGWKIVALKIVLLVDINDFLTESLIILLFSLEAGVKVYAVGGYVDSDENSKETKISKNIFTQSLMIMKLSPVEVSVLYFGKCLYDYSIQMIQRSISSYDFWFDCFLLHDALFIKCWMLFNYQFFSKMSITELTFWLGFLYDPLNRKP